jgi:hypothetical protein
LLFVQAKAQELLNYPLDTVNGEEVYKYEVERSIGLYRIGVNFNVSQNDIIRLNPQLRERGLHYGETLLIPTGRKVEIGKPKAESDKPKPEIVKPTTLVEPAQEPKVIVDTTSNKVEQAQPSNDPEPLPATDSLPSRRVMELALMLPFESQQTKRSSNAERMMEFYQGALLTLRDLQNDSTLYRLRVYDTERSELRVNALCDSTELDSVQGVLGLVYPIQIERMASWCETHRVPLLLPFSDDIDLTIHSQVLQFNSTDSQEADSLCQWMLAKDSTIHCVAVEVRESDLSSPIRTLRRRMSAHGISYSGLPLRDLMIDSCSYVLDPLKENLIILHSDRYQHVRMLMPHLVKLYIEGYRIRIVSQYSWQKEEITLPQVYTTMFKTEQDHAVYDAIWDEIYSGGHVSEAPRYDLLGYDLMQALIGWLNGDKERVGLQSDIRWQQIKEGGYQNAQVKVVEK